MRRRTRGQIEFNDLALHTTAMTNTLSQASAVRDPARQGGTGHLDSTLDVVQGRRARLWDESSPTGELEAFGGRLDPLLVSPGTTRGPSTNPLELLHNVVKRRTAAVAIFPDLVAHGAVGRNGSRLSGRPGGRASVLSADWMRQIYEPGRGETGEGAGAARLCRTGEDESGDFASTRRGATHKRVRVSIFTDSDQDFRSGGGSSSQERTTATAECTATQRNRSYTGVSICNWA
jgi:hypothetical protein